MDAARALRLYREGLLDSEIAERLGVSRSTVWNWRQGLGLSAIGRKGRPYLVDDAQARILHARGLSDTAIAAALGRPRRTITRWRRTAGLPRNGFERSGQAPAAPPVPQILQQMMAAARRENAALTAAWGRQ
ncbi:helix-turn-helix domain-containing protein [Sagittula sp.]|uniref:helix-turn-helix domain-containing protein n=1 Tax=Sagittula sp. TaxID=2038081 RepID=UPI00351788BD